MFKCFYSILKIYNFRNIVHFLRRTLSPSYTKEFSSLIDLVAWPVQREVSTKPRKSQALTWGLGTNTLPSIFSGIYRRCIDHKILWAISALLFFVAGKASRVLVDRWITSETFYDVQNANRRCTGHATMSTERGNYGLITVRAPFLAIGPNKKPLSNCCMEALSHWPEMKNSGRCSSLNFTKKILYLHVSHTAGL